MTRLRVGIVGCGEVVQLIHLPTLQSLRDRFEVTASCDVSAHVRSGVGDAWEYLWWSAAEDFVAGCSVGFGFVSRYC